MLRLTIKNLLANKARLALTAMAVVLGVSFVVASFVLSDGLRGSFDTLSKEIFEGTDLVVRDTDDFGVVASIDEALEADLNDLDGIRVAAGVVGGEGAQPVRADGTAVTTIGPPIISTSWVREPELNLVTLVDGTAPQHGQFAMDEDSARREGFVIGDSYMVVTASGTYDFTLSGTTRFGPNNETNGAILMGFDIEDARSLLGVAPGTFDEINISLLDGYVASDVQSEMAASLPAGLEVVNQQSLEEEAAGEFNEGISILRNVLLGFAGISLFVSTFIIYNTFGIVVAQRMREIGLLRAVGADASQIRRGVLGEAVIIGTVASAAGLVGGIALNSGLRALFSLLGADLPHADLILAPRTIIVAFALGIGVTVVSSLSPAARASRVSPITAMIGSASGEDGGGRSRVVAGLATLAAGVGVGAFGLQGSGSITATVATLGAGATLVFLGVTLLSPVLARPVLSIVGWPIHRLFGVAGTLARQNAMRHPRRTSTTAAALMIGLSLVTMALVVGDSLKTQIGETLESSTYADYVVAGQDFAPFPAAVADEIDALTEVGTTVAVREVHVRVGDETLWYNSADFDDLGALFDLGVDQGAMAETGRPALALPTAEAAELNLTIGDMLPVQFENGHTTEFELVATFTDQSLIDGGFINLASANAQVPVAEYEWLAAAVASDSTAAQAEAAMETIREGYPQLDVQSNAEYRESIEGEIDSLLNTINALLALAIFIALLGIGLTLALAIVERTRELGLLRAVGMTRRQMRRMVRWEAATIALFGAVMGVAIGLVFGWAAVQAMPDTFITTVSVPVERLLTMVAIAAIAGLLAALLPARRAGRLNVLDAIAQA